MATDCPGSRSGACHRTTCTIRRCCSSRPKGGWQCSAAFPDARFRGAVTCAPLSEGAQVNGDQGAVSGGRDMRRAVLAVAGAAILWSTGGLFIKLAPMPALAVACGRLLLPRAFYLVVLRPDPRRPRLAAAGGFRRRNLARRIAA